MPLWFVLFQFVSTRLLIPATLRKRPNFLFLDQISSLSLEAVIPVPATSSNLPHQPYTLQRFVSS
ncbi:hypothetical protein M758_5G158600 [Ceratodon purpureus]|uniref:Secreted protein n=1 Tax=Ceratodon purpureus TaxID=3225 RepID=A0A8T0I4U6_CERPU|nr:hypothetical protein KC19_5G165900 [Ceratodon purpureus]KAG0617015.1 hypothetical protein M758_5G158600 [Ceratodon purpureus]